MIRRAPLGYLPWVFAAMLGLGAVDVLLSGRDLSQLFLELEAGGGVSQHPLMPWLQRAVSVLLLLAVAERVSNHIEQKRPVPSAVLVGAYLLYWLCTVVTTALFGTHPQVSHEYLYPVAIGGAALLATAAERDRILEVSRDALFVMLALGAGLIFVMPSLVMDSSYSQGLIPGLPRHGGLAPHPVALGMFAQTALLLLWYRPYRRTGLNWACCLVGLAVLFLAQSKTAWIAMVLCSICMLLVRSGGSITERIGDPRDNSFGVIACAGVILAVLVAGGLMLSGALDAHGDSFFDSAEGAQLMSLTGRDRIWEIAVEEWQANPVFGYGPTLWDDAFRQSINMPNATNAHNQFMDTLARSGSVGAISLVLYAAVLMFLSIKYAKATRGLSLALFVALALRSVTEVPMLLLGYGYELFSHLLLLVTIAGAAAVRQPQASRVPRSIYRVAS